MYLAVINTKKQSLYQLFYGWTTGNPQYRDMRPYLIAKLAPSVYLYNEDDWVRRVLLSAQRNYGREDVRVMRVTEMDLDLRSYLPIRESHIIPDEKLG